MNKKIIIPITTILIIVVSTVLWMGSCRKSVDPILIKDAFNTVIAARVLENTSYTGNNNDYIGIDNAMVELNNGSTTYSDSNGDFTFTDIAPGNYNIIIFKEGYAKGNMTIKEENFIHGFQDIFLAKLSEPIIIDENGGVFITDHFSLNIPPNAVNQPTEIRITKTPEFWNDYDTDYLPVFSINCEPNGLIFNKPISIGFPIPEEFLFPDSLGVNVKIFDENLFKWLDSDVLWKIKNDSIFTELEHFTNYVFLLTLVYEWDWTSAWISVGAWEVEEAEGNWGTKCAGIDGATFVGPSKSKSVSLSVGSTILYLSVSGQVTTTETVSAGSNNVPACKCCTYYGRMDRQKWSRNLRYRMCDVWTYIPGVVPNCSPYFNLTVTKYKYVYVDTKNECVDNGIDECHKGGS